MTTSEATAKAHGIPSRTNLLESKMDWAIEQIQDLASATPTDPGDPPDLTDVVAAINKLYNLTIRGAEATATYPLTYASAFDMDGDTAAGGSSSYSSVLHLVLGNYAGSQDALTNGRNLKNVSLYDQLLSSPNTTKYPFNTTSSQKSLATMLFTTPAQASLVKTRGSMMSILFASIDPAAAVNASTMLDNWGSLYRACFASTTSYESDTLAHTKSLLRRIQDLEARMTAAEADIAWLGG